MVRKKIWLGVKSKNKIFKGQIKKNKMMEKTKLVRGKIGKKIGGHGYCSLTFIKNMIRGKMKKKMIEKKWLKEK